MGSRPMEMKRYGMGPPQHQTVPASAGRAIRRRPWDGHRELNAGGDTRLELKRLKQSEIEGMKKGRRLLRRQ